MLNHGGHIYFLEKEGGSTCITLVFADTGDVYSDVIGAAWDEYELTNVLNDLIAQGEADFDRQAEDSIASH